MVADNRCLACVITLVREYSTTEDQQRPSCWLIRRPWTSSVPSADRSAAVTGDPICHPEVLAINSGRMDPNHTVSGLFWVKTWRPAYIVAIYAGLHGQEQHQTSSQVVSCLSPSRKTLKTGYSCMEVTATVKATPWTGQDASTLIIGPCIQRTTTVYGLPITIGSSSITICDISQVLNPIVSSIDWWQSLE